MGQASTTEIFNASAKKIFEVITNYSSYPEIIPDVKRATVVETPEPGRRLVEFEMQLIKTFRYKLWLTETPCTELSWKFHSGDIFKENSGSWVLKELEGGEKTQVTYSISAKFTLFVPGLIEKKLIEVNLPSMMKAYRERVEA